MSVRVVKIGGAALADDAWLAAFAREASRSSARLLIVHGGGPDINDVAGVLGLGFAWVDGRRVTSPELLDVVSMVLNGRVNKRIVRALRSAGVDAIGLSGEDGGLIEADIAGGGTIGRVGAVRAVRGELLGWAEERGLVPVIAPVSAGLDGGALNVNADEAAAAVAVAAGADELLFITDVAGVLDAGVVRTELSVVEAASLIETGVATGGMALKLRAATRALETGVAGVRIGSAAALADEAAGTRIRQGSEVVAWR
jgi:acetylglutamate kinase